MPKEISFGLIASMAIAATARVMEKSNQGSALSMPAMFRKMQAEPRAGESHEERVYLDSFQESIAPMLWIILALDEPELCREYIAASLSDLDTVLVSLRTAVRLHVGLLRSVRDGTMTVASCTNDSCSGHCLAILNDTELRALESNASSSQD